MNLADIEAEVCSLDSAAVIVFRDVPPECEEEIFRTVVEHFTALAKARLGSPPAVLAVPLVAFGDVTVLTETDMRERGTPKDNVRDRIERGRSAHPKGQMHPMAKFTDAQATEIVRRRMSGEGNNALAREFGVSPTTICSMVHGRTWAHISLPPHQIEVQPPAGIDV